MKKRKIWRKRVVSAVTIVVMLVSIVLPYMSMVVSAEEGNTLKVSNMKLNLLAEPYGIPTKNLSFSWAMEDQDSDEFQTAYQIMIQNSSGNLVKDTGWVESKQSAGVQIEGLQLENNSLYTWTVKIKDKDGNESAGMSQTFTTEVGDKWKSRNGIWDDTSVRGSGSAGEIRDLFLENEWTNYAVEMDIKVSQTALGIAFRALNEGNNAYFWQFRSDTNSIVPHYVQNGQPQSYGKGEIALNESVKAIKNDEFTKIKLQVIGDKVTTYVESANVESANVESANVESANVESANVESANVESANVESANVESANVESANVESANVESANVESANVESANIESANVESANVESANVESTNVESTNEEDVFVQVGEPFQLDKNFSYGSVGFRTGKFESGFIDNVKIYRVNEDGSPIENGTLFETDFADTNAFPIGTIENGELAIPTEVSIPKVLLQESVYPEANIPVETITPTGNFIFARDEFTFNNEKELKKAIVSISAKSPEHARQFVYNLYVNGKIIGVGPARFDTDPSDGSGVVYYNTYDVTEYVKANGNNAIGALCYTTQEKALLCQLTAFYTDGTSEVITNSAVSADGWKTKDGTNAFGENGNSIGTQYFMAASQNINANFWPTGWDKAGYEMDASWLAPKNQGAYVGSYDLESYPAENVTRYEVKPVSVEKITDNRYRIDLGKEIVGSLALVGIESASSTKLDVRYGEEFVATGELKYEMRTGNKYQEYWTLKKGTQTIEGSSLMTFRYVEVHDCPVELTTDNVRGLALRQAFSSDESSFESSDSLLNQIYDVTKYSIKATNQDLMVDSQSRERGAYEGDLVINALSSYSFEDDYALSRFSNEWLATHRGWPAEYVLFTVNNAWNDYMYTGDTKSLEEYYKVFNGSSYNRQNLYTDNMGTNGLLRYETNGQNTTDAILVDWPVSETDNYDRREYNTVFNAVAYQAYCDMAKIAGVLGKTSDQSYWQNLADKIKTAMITNLYDASKGAFRDGVGSSHYSQHATAFALAYGIYEDQAMADKLVAYIESQGEIKTSVYGSLFLLQGLYEAGAGDVAMDLMTSSGTRSWDHMINELGATITTEAWDPGKKTNMTFSHPWGSAPASQIVRGMFGIQPVKPGFESFNIKIQPGDVKEASVKIPTVKGSIEASYNTSATKITTNFTVPANTTAKVQIPVPPELEEPILTMGGVQIPVSNTDSIAPDAARSILSATIEDGYATLELGSGTYNNVVLAASKIDPINTKGLLAYFDFDNDGYALISDTASGIVVADVANGSEPTLIASEETGGEAIYFDGTANEHLSVRNTTGANILTGLTELTVSFDMKADVGNGAKWPFYAAPNGNGPIYLNEKYLGIYSNGDLTAERYNNSGSRSEAATSPSIEGEWHNVTVVYTESNTILYIDGVEVDRASGTVDIDGMLGNNPILYIGMAPWGGGERFQGYLDNYAIFNYALSEEEIADLNDVTMQTIYFDNAISMLTAIDNESIYYSVDGGEWKALEEVTAENAPEGKDVCLESLWKAEIPSNADTIIFRGQYDGRGNNEDYPIGQYVTSVLDLPADLEKNNCFYGAPIVSELSKGMAPTINGTSYIGLIGGNWAPVDEINTYSSGSNDIPSGEYIKDENLYYGVSTFYDYYSDYELWSLMLQSSKQAKVEDGYGDQPLHTWNLAISDYYAEEANRSENPVYPLYFGGFRMLNITQNDLLNHLNRYDAAIQNGNGFSGLSNQNKITDGTSGAYFPNQGLLSPGLDGQNIRFTDEPAVEADGNFKNTYLKNSNLPTPYFNESFILGQNVFKSQLGSVYKNIDFPFVKDESTSYWVFDSSNASHVVRVKEDENGYYLDRPGEKNAVLYNGTPYFFPFTDGKAYTDDGAAGQSTSNLNYMFGSVIEVPFTLSRDRMVTVDKTTEDGTPQVEQRNTVFTFSGDDDVWIVLETPDGKQQMVLDIGGSHGAVSGAIDFTTGMVATSGHWSYLNGENQAFAMNNKEFIRLAEEYGLGPDSPLVTTYSRYVQTTPLTKLGINVEDYIPFDEYKIQIYYMERGLDQSNLRVSFNFEKEKNIIVEKAWSDGNEDKETLPVSLYEIVEMDGNKNDLAILTQNEHIGSLELPKDSNNNLIGATYVNGNLVEATIGLQNGNNWRGGWIDVVTTEQHEHNYVHEYYVAEPDVPDGYKVSYYDKETGEPLELVTIKTVVDPNNNVTRNIQAVFCKKDVSSISIKIVNERIANLVITKKGYQDGTDENDKLLPGVRFELYKADVKTAGEGENRVETWTKLLEETDTDDKSYKSAVTDENGVLRIDELTEGNYLLYEVESDANADYVVNKEPWKVSVDGEGIITLVSPTGTIVEGETDNDSENGGVDNNYTVTNYPKALQITKADAEDPSTLLAGVEFTLQEIDENRNPVGSPKKLVTGDGKEGNESLGVVTIPNIEEGSYLLTEVKTLKGYKLLKNALIITVTEDGLITVAEDSLIPGDGQAINAEDINGVPTYKLTILNRQEFTLPSTGGIGIILIVLTGLAIVGVSRAIYITGLRKKRRVRAHRRR